MQQQQNKGVDKTAVRVALWRAMHVHVDPPPHVLEDVIGLQLIDPDDEWRLRPDMRVQATSRARASIVARSRFIEDTVAEQADQGVSQYVLLGAGLDTFAQRRPEIASRLRIFEIDQPSTQIWKRQRLMEFGYGIPEWLQFVPVDFEANDSWWDQLIAAGFDSTQPAVVVSTGVSMYLTNDANAATLRQIAKLAPGSTFAMTFMLPLELVEPEERPGREATEKFAKMAGTPFISLFSPGEMLELAQNAGLRDSQHISAADLTQRYFTGRADNLRPSSSEALLIAKTS